MANIAFSLPKGFVYLKSVAPTIKQQMMYYSSDNFVGRRIKGYQKPKCILTQQAAAKLQEAQTELVPAGLSIVVYDCYRPKSAVRDFVSYSKTKSFETHDKFYPNLKTKQALFDDGYVSYTSRHSGGSTIDLALVEKDDDSYYVGCKSPGKTLSLDFGSGVDCLDPIAHTYNSHVSKQVAKQRKFLVGLLSRHGFSNYPKEWWHFTLREEPYPDKRFNFVVK